MTIPPAPTRNLLLCVKRALLMIVAGIEDYLKHA